MYTKEQLIDIVKKDMSLKPDEKLELVTKLSDHSFFDHVSNGAAGAGAGFVIAKFLNLSKPAQVVLTLAGFGIGKYLLDTARKHDKFLQYNNKLKVYEIDKQ